MIKYRVFPKIFKIFETLCSESPHLYLSPAVRPPTKRKKFSCNIMGKRFCSILTRLSTTATFFKRFFFFPLLFALNSVLFSNTGCFMKRVTSLSICKMYEYSARKYTRFWCSGRPPGQLMDCWTIFTTFTTEY